jgi:hypothetical protein
MPELQDAIAQAQKYIRALDGIKSAPENPPDSVNVYPFVICFPGTGIVKFGPTGAREGLHSIVIEVHMNRANLPHAVEKVLPFGDSIPNLLMDKLLNDNKWNYTVDTFRDVSYVFGPLGYGDTPTIGWRFTVNEVKIVSTIT